MIVLNTVQADNVRGATRNGAALNPVPHPSKPGKFVLPDAVLDDSDHMDHHIFLSTLPKENVVFSNEE